MRQPPAQPCVPGIDGGTGAERGLECVNVAYEELRIEIRQLDPELPLPSYGHRGDAGADLCASEDVVLEPGQRRAVGTGIAIALPEGYAGFVHPRSGLSTKHGITVVNSPGTIDAGYRGEIKVPLINVDPHSACTNRRGDRIAQLIIQRVVHADFHVVESLEESERGSGGFGSTGGFTANGHAPRH